MYYIGHDEGTPEGDYPCELIMKMKNGVTTVLAEKINGRTTTPIRFGFYKILTQISKLTSYRRKRCVK
jgi:hypothetical protein